jgi:hypothetical protein
MPDRFIKLRTRHKHGRVVTYWQDRLTGNTFAMASASAQLEG